MGEGMILSINGAGSTEYTYGEKNNPEPLCHRFIKINSGWILDLNVKGKMIKLLEANTG